MKAFGRRRGVRGEARHVIPEVRRAIRDPLVECQGARPRFAAGSDWRCLSVSRRPAVPLNGSRLSFQSAGMTGGRDECPAFQTGEIRIHLTPMPPLVAPC